MVEKEQLVIPDLTEREQTILNLLRIFFLKKLVPEEYYCIGNINDMTYCVIKQNNIWETFYYESGHKHFKKQFNDVTSACSNLFERFEENLDKKDLVTFKQQIEELENNYSNAPQKTKTINKKTT